MLFRHLGELTLKYSMNGFIKVELQFYLRVLNIHGAPKNQGYTWTCAVTWFACWCRRVSEKRWSCCWVFALVTLG